MTCIYSQPKEVSKFLRELSRQAALKKCKDCKQKEIDKLQSAVTLQVATEPEILSNDEVETM